MPSVVREGEPRPAVEVVKLTVAPTQRVANPPRRTAGFLLDQSLDAIAVANALGDLAFPIALKVSQKRTALFVTQQAVHFLVVAFQTDLDPSVIERRCKSCRRLPTALGTNVACGGEPQVSRQTQPLIRQQIDVLDHVGVTRFERPSWREFPIQREARLEARIRRVLNIQHGPVKAHIDRKVFSDVDLIFHIQILFVADQIALTNERVQRILLPKVKFKLQRARGELMAGQVASKTNEVPSVWCKVHINFGGVVLDAGAVQ